MTTAPSDDELKAAYAGKRVFVTGHTGFKGGWLTVWLAELGAQVTGYSLAPETQPNFFKAAAVSEICQHNLGDVRDMRGLTAALRDAKPDYIFHLAAQSLVRPSYERPLETLETNVMGTAHLLEVVRQERLRCAVVVVTSDKCYENRERAEGYREEEAMGGHDVYSMSKGATELLVSSYRRSFFAPAHLEKHGVALATARAGNVIGGGDWATDRLVPDIIKALAAHKPIPVRNPGSVRPWQHVLEPIGGYLLLGARLKGVGTTYPSQFCEAWNFGPKPDSTVSVKDLVTKMISAWGTGSWEDKSNPEAVHEANLLSLSIDKAERRLGWAPRWSIDTAIRCTAKWYQDAAKAASPKDVRSLTSTQLADYRTGVKGGTGVRPAVG